MTEPHPHLTKNQALVLDALAKEGVPLSAYAILDRLRDDGLRAPLQVYRALDKLLDYELVHRLESLNAFVACAHPHCHASRMIAFGICETCGQVWEFSDDVVRDRLMAWAESNQFRPSKTTVEIKGTCASCAEAAAG
ncbi:Fur family transcriptional regulator [Consotaella aegiceratis]|uniref:Fur family transcriptional regulator n=1 Tax=Consotaella aegiceratis TaxID=3097961 RepID=UPI002F427AF1